VDATAVTRKGQVTIPKELRQPFGIRQGTRIEFSLVSDHVEMRVKRAPSGKTGRGFGMLESSRAAVPTDFDVATLHVPCRDGPRRPRIGVSVVF
jgi:AbrB family looped-hinge helix DNA binding protein